MTVRKGVSTGDLNITKTEEGQYTELSDCWPILQGLL